MTPSQSNCEHEYQFRGSEALEVEGSCIRRIRMWKKCVRCGDVVVYFKDAKP